MATFKNLKDQRRVELIIPYVPKEDTASEQSFGDTVGTALPMAAMFTRHKLIGWTSVVFAVQQWLNENPSQVAAGKQPAFFMVGMAVMSLLITYMPIFFPPPNATGTGTAPAPAPA